MPITTQQEYGFSHRPSYSRRTTTHRSVSLGDAIGMVVRGEIAAMDVFSGMPQDMQDRINKVVSDTTGKQFKDISAEEKKNVFMMISIAQDNSDNQAQDEPQTFSAESAHTPDNISPLKHSEPPPRQTVSNSQGTSNTQVHNEPQTFSTESARTVDTSRSPIFSVPPPLPTVSKKWWQFWR